MDVTHLIPRRLDLDSCVIVGTQLEAAIKAHKDAQQKLSPPLEAATQALIHATQELRLLEEGDSKMLEIDRATDRCVVGWSDLHESIQRMLTGDDLLPLTDDERAFQEASRKINAISYPNGTGFIRYTFRRQWAQLQKVKKALQSLEPELKSTGLSLLSNRFVRWIDLYGAKLGITEESDELTDKTASTIESWHKALGNVFFELINYSRDPQNKDANEIRDLLMAPYEQQAELERQETRERRKKRKAQV